jgi:hypothetical protein
MAELRWLPSCQRTFAGANGCVVALRLPKAHPGVNGLLLLGAWPKAGRPLLLLLLLVALLSLLDSRPLKVTDRKAQKRVLRDV